MLENKFNKTASERARLKTLEISKKAKISSPKPLTVLIIVLDSVSRYHFYRNLVQTVNFLNSNIVTGKYSDKYAIYDFLINNAQGLTTLPNMIPMIYGYEYSDLQQKLENFSIFNESDWHRFEEIQNQDAIWKHFEEMGFVTMFGYDTVNDYLSLCTGRKIFTDHVASNFYHGAAKIFSYNDFSMTQRCLGTKNAHRYLLDYANQFIKNYQGYNRFGYIHLSPGHENTGTVIKTADKDLVEFFTEIFENFDHKNEDIMINFLSDHGKHSDKWDLDYEGIMENRLPMHFLMANKELITRIGKETDDILKLNTKRLVIRYD